MDPQSLRHDMEKMMGKLGRLAQDKNLSIEDLNELLVGRTLDEIDSEMGDLILSDQEKAKDMVYQALDESNPALRKTIIDNAIALYPHLPNAWLIKAEDEALSPEQALEYLERAVIAGEKDLVKNFFQENEGHFWGLIETRPYMRAKAALADLLWQLEREDEAISHYQDCLRLNHNDNQGIRDVLLNCLLVKNDLDGAEKLLKRYKDDFGASHAFNKALFLFKKHGPESKRAGTQMEKSISLNGFVPQYLLGKRKLPQHLPNTYAFKSKEEAIIYAEGAMRAWKETPGAIRWLAVFFF